jgi:hypothetical protein
MGLRKVGFGSILDEIKQAEEDVWTPNCATVIECELCSDKLYYHDLIIDEKVISMTCQCEAIRIVPFPATMARYNDFLGIKWHGKYPKIYEIPYEEYLKIKQ